LFYIYGKNGRFFSCRFIRVNILEFQRGDLYTEEQTRRFFEKYIKMVGMLINIWQKPKIKTIL
jgi:hypothetical protein